MSIQEPLDATLITSSPFASRAPKALQRLEAWLEKGSEYLNPILVKEARQSLKSRQFVITFSLLLICGWLWSLAGLAILKNGVHFAPSGRFMLVGYIWILAFPLVIIVPFSAFRSLSSEREDGTYELLSITTLLPRQIIGGKLGSSVLQILIYLSALSPCLAFTYLLRGIDILSILVIIFWSFMTSVLLSTIGLLFATLTRARHWQIVLMVAIILALAFAFFFACGMASTIVLSGVMTIDEPLFWIGQLAALFAWIAAFGLCFLAATARITFVSDNRSTKLRIWMLICHLAMVGWFFYGAVAWRGEIGAIAMYGMVAVVYWWCLGAMMVGERSEISPRVRRSLPQSFLGRVFLTFFQPGPGTGYLLMVSQLSVVLLFSIAISLVSLGSGQWTMSGFPAFDEVVTFLVILCCYAIIYVGVGRLLMRAMGRVVVEGPVVSFLLNVILVAIGVLAPFILQMSLAGSIMSDDYSVLQVSNPFWTAIEAIDRDLGSAGIGPFGLPLVALILVQAAGLVFIANLLLSAGEIVPPRAPVPVRVLRDDRELHPVKEGPVAPKNPWDTAPAP